MSSFNSLNGLSIRKKIIYLQKNFKHSKNAKTKVCTRDGCIVENGRHCIRSVPDNAKTRKTASQEYIRHFL